MKDLNLNVDVDNHTAYKACLDIHSQSPYPRLPIIELKFHGGAAAVAMMITLVSWMSAEIGQYTAYAIFPALCFAILPPYKRFLKLILLYCSDQLMTEYRTKRIKDAYLRNFYDS